MKITLKMGNNTGGGNISYEFVNPLDGEKNDEGRIFYIGPGCEKTVYITMDCSSKITKKNLKTGVFKINCKIENTKDDKAEIQTKIHIHPVENPDDSSYSPTHDMEQKECTGNETRGNAEFIVSNKGDANDPTYFVAYERYNSRFSI